MVTSDALRFAVLCIVAKNYQTTYYSSILLDKILFALQIIECLKILAQ